MTTVGYSHNADFNEALKNALANIGTSPCPGWRLEARVTETGHDGGADGQPPCLYVVVIRLPAAGVRILSNERIKTQHP